MPQNTEKKAFFTIITVTLNNLEGLKRTAESLHVQTFQHFEWIVLDGGSNDGTTDYLKSTHAKWSSQPDNGIYDAMNKGMEQASGLYLLFLNAGDTLMNTDILQKTANAAANTPDFIYGDSIEDGSYKPARTLNIAGGMFTHHQAMFYNRTSIGDIRYNTDYKIAADYGFTARFLQRDIKTLYCNFPICNFESGGISQQHASLGRHEQYQIRKELKLTSPFKNTIITIAQTLLWQLRCLAPSLYWHLKSSGNTHGANTQNETLPPHPETPA